MLNMLFRRVDHPTLVSQYLAARREDWALTYYLDTKRHLERSVPSLSAKPTRPEIVILLDGVERASGKRTADVTRIALSGYFTWLLDKGTLAVNPTNNMRSRSRGRGRERFLSENEIRAVWSASPPVNDYGRVLRLLLLTGCRAAEIGSMTWNEIDLEQRTLNLPAHRVKNRRPHIVPLSDLAIAQLPPRRDGHPHVFGFRRGHGFDGWSKAKRELDAVLIGMPKWVVHDMRRTFVTHAMEKGLAPPHIIEAVVNHVSGHKGGVAGIYNRAQYATEKRAALDAWALEVSRIIGNIESV